MPAPPTHPAYGRLRAVTPFASALLAENPSPMTLDGTNTWVLRAPGSAHCVVVDPGPDDEAHLRRVAAHGPVAEVLLTHGHPDHAAGARRFADLVGAPVHAVDPAHRLGSEGLREGDVVAGAGLEIRVLATPGHTSDSLCFRIRADEPAAVATGVSVGAVLTGDTVLGRGTTMIAHPDGRLGDYLDSLRRLAELPPGVIVLPGHGPDLPDAGEAARGYLTHREERLEQVRVASIRLREDIGREPRPRQVVEVVYADVDPALWPAADASVAAQLEYLRALS
jgi:glyoxylase-like metal-dependent hydrolase (beta-lactamase superfamily II)